MPEWTKGTACKAVKPRVQIPPDALQIPLCLHLVFGSPIALDRHNIKKLKSGGPLWTEIARDGLVVHGAPLPMFSGGRMLVDIADKDALWDVLDADGLR